MCEIGKIVAVVQEPEPVTAKEFLQKTSRRPMKTIFEPTRKPVPVPARKKAAPKELPIDKD